MKLLMLEDDVETSDYLRRSLEECGHKVHVVGNGQVGLAHALTTAYDVMVVDRMLPGLDGMSVVKAIRAAGLSTPVLFLTTMSGVGDRVEGLEAGGDDYLVKPFAFVELSARINALGRRAHERPDTCLKLADLEVDLMSRRVRRANRDIELQPREFELLRYMLANTGRLVTRTMLLEAIWNFHFDPKTNIVETHMSRLRSKMDKGFDHELLVTIRGSGYILRAPS